MCCANDKQLKQIESLVQTEEEFVTMLRREVKARKMRNEDAAETIVDVVQYPPKKRAVVKKLSVPDWQITKTYCVSAKPDARYNCKVRLTDHTFGDMMPKGALLKDVTVESEQRKAKKDIQRRSKENLD